MNIRLSLSFAALICTSVSVAQLSTAVYLGAGPGKNLSSNSEYAAQVMGNKDFILKPEHQGMTYTGGLSAYYTFPSRFLIGGELQYRTSSIEYAFWDTAGDSEYSPSMTIVEYEHNIALPVFVGVRLWDFTVYSGVNANFIVGKSADFNELESFTDTGSKFYMGWHAGLGYHLGPVELEARYMQDFKNYGSGYQISDKDMIFYGNRSRWAFLVKYNLLHGRASGE